MNKGYYNHLQIPKSSIYFWETEVFELLWSTSLFLLIIRILQKYYCILNTCLTVATFSGDLIEKQGSPYVLKNWLHNRRIWIQLEHSCTMKWNYFQLDETKFPSLQVLKVLFQMLIFFIQRIFISTDTSLQDVSMT